MFKYDIISVEQLNDAQKEEVWKLLVLTDEEFVPTLSSRNSTVQTILKTNEQIDLKSPIAYFEALADQYFILALDNQRVIGFLSYIPNHNVQLTANENLISNYVSTIIVNPTYRSQGITVALYDFLMKQTNKTIATRTWSTNYAHLKILEKLGFKNVLTIENDRGNGIDTVYFARQYIGTTP
jgi:ribosomal protein S18 acetylase RimI-like enzyme